MSFARLSDIAQHLEAELHGDNDILISGIASLQSAKEGQITFFSVGACRKQLKMCRAAAVVLASSDLSSCPCAALVVKDPYVAYAHLAQMLDTTPVPATGIASSATIDPSAVLGNNVSLGAHVVIESGVVLGDNVVIGPGCFVGKNTQIGNDTRLWANVTLYHGVRIGSHCLIQSGAVIGSDGFGYANDRGNWIKIPQLGRVIIGDKVEIGASTTIDRGALDDTVIESGVIIDNQCQIAHNVHIGERTAVAGGVIMAGSLRVGRNCMIGGASVLNGHMEICDNVVITGMGMVMRPVTEPGIYSSGIPLQPNKTWRKTAVLAMNIDKIDKRLKIVENKIREND